MWWGEGGRFYWGRREAGRTEGIVVAFAWTSSEEKHMRQYIELYGSNGWNSLVCHADFLTMYALDGSSPFDCPVFFLNFTVSFPPIRLCGLFRAWRCSVCYYVTDERLGEENE